MKHDEAEADMGLHEVNASELWVNIVFLNVGSMNAILS